jgi:hypothetical protein
MIFWLQIKKQSNLSIEVFIIICWILSNFFLFLQKILIAFIFPTGTLLATTNILELFYFKISFLILKRRNYFYFNY